MEYLQRVIKGRRIQDKREWEWQNSFHKYFNSYNVYYWEMGSSHLQIPSNLIMKHKLIRMCIPDLYTGRILQEFYIPSYFQVPYTPLLFVKMKDLEKHRIY